MNAAFDRAGLGIRSSPSASPAAPSKVRRTTANALIGHSRSRRSAELNMDRPQTHAEAQIFVIPRLTEKPNNPLANRRAADSTVGMIRRGFLDSELRKDLTELARDGSAAHRLVRCERAGAAGRPA